MEKLNDAVAKLNILSLPRIILQQDCKPKGSSWNYDVSFDEKQEHKYISMLSAIKPIDNLQMIDNDEMDKNVYYETRKFALSGFRPNKINIKKEIHLNDYIYSYLNRKIPNLLTSSISCIRQGTDVDNIVSKDIVEKYKLSDMDVGIVKDFLRELKSIINYFTIVENKIFILLTEVTCLLSKQVFRNSKLMDPKLSIESQDTICRILLMNDYYSDILSPKATADDKIPLFIDINCSNEIRNYNGNIGTILGISIIASDQVEKETQYMFGEADYLGMFGYNPFEIKKENGKYFISEDICMFIANPNALAVIR